MSIGRPPNHQLRELLAEARWNGEQMADAVNRVGSESGLNLSYGRASVHQWLTGTLPRRTTAHLACAALGRRLRRPVTLADAGFDDTRAPSPPLPVDTGLLVHLAAASAAPHRAGSLLAYRPPAHPDPTGAGTGPPAPEVSAAAQPPPRGGGRTGTRPDVLALLLPVFSAVDRLKGGGHARTALATFLATTAAPMLSAPGPPLRRTAALGDAARLSYLCAFMHVDDELNGLADHYYRLALDLARHAGDTATRAMTLRAMAAQAYELGHRRASLRLARAAADCRLAPTSTRLRAAVLGQLALSEAATGDRPAALRHIDAARDLLAHITSPPPPVGDYHRASWDHQRALVAAELGDPTAATTFLETSSNHRPRTETRSHTLVLAKLAERQLATGHLEAACTTWHAFLDLYPHLASRRARTARTRLPGLLLPHRHRHSADQLLQRAATVHHR
ncbi:hypothetical protein ACIQ9P_26895 [Kitasatospora sp. NPDC094019]|uniref:hypothetical protein n=1 Tax=Kitasatospora sp. NPDC094019 TaxID=3364091 RepID=UPI0038192FEB